MAHRSSWKRRALAAAFLTAFASQASAIELEMPSYQIQDAAFGEWWKAAAAEFAKQNPGHSIKLIPVSFNEHHDQPTTRFVAGSPPDLAHISARFYFGYADQGFLEPLDKRLSAIGWKEDDFISAQKQMKRNGQVYGQALLGYAWGLFYNADMFDKAKVAVPTTRDAFMAAARALTVDRNGDGRADQHGFALASDKSSQTYMNLSYLLTGLGYGWTANGALLPKSQLREALAMTAQFVKENASPPALNSDQTRQLFWQGNAAMYIDGSWAPGYKKSATPEVQKAFRVAPVPFIDEAGGPSNVLTIPAKLPEDRKVLAFKFLELIQSPAWQQRYTEMTGNPPARIMPLSEQARAAWPELEVFVKSAARAKQSYLPLGHEADFVKWSSIVADGVTGLVSGGLSVDQATDQIHQELSREFF
jgi:multiple sugar transport system substrate-binding protein